MNFFERKFAPVMAKAITGQIKDVTAILKHNGLNSARSYNDSVLINVRVSDAIKHIYKTVGVYFANDSYRNIQDQLKQSKKGFGFNQEWINEILRYFQLNLLTKATVPITETTKEFIRQILIKGEQEGWGYDKMAYELEHSDLTINRARLIVRTESAKAMFKGRDLAHKKSPYQLSLEWIAANDARTRHSHRLVDGVVIEEGKRFSVPIYRDRVQIGIDLMEGPGDPRAHKSNIINCRCTTAERIMFDANDEPIMKRNLISL